MSPESSNSPSQAATFARAEREHWRVERADRATVIVDAADYFVAARAAMLKARHRILLIGWDFDARTDLGRADGETERAPRRVGRFILWLVRRNPALEVHLLRWDVGALKAVFRGLTVFTVLRWMLHPRIHTKLDGCHPTGASHHQKIVIIDDSVAFCGGIDMTQERWDTRRHADHEPGRRTSWGRRYKPWHDATTAVEGAAARALGDLFRDRWQRSTGVALTPPPGGGDCWPDGLEPDFVGQPTGIARTVPAMREQQEHREIEALTLALIARAKRLIYAESQYFASRKVAEAIARRIDEPDGPDIVLINPLAAQGWLEPIAMDTARARLIEALRRRPNAPNRLRVYHPFTAEGHPIYVHAKILIVDEEVIRVGSSNFNNRSMGLDTECDMTLDARLADDPVRSATRIAAIRDGLVAEHLGRDPAEIGEAVAAQGSLGLAIEALRQRPGRTLVPYVTPTLSGLEQWLADNELLDPESPAEMFESLAKRDLLARLRR
jgi:phosphatidylserine/phosphatidylglycerophosphate/cardiolipin synthase-like enzyme